MTKETELQINEFFELYLILSRDAHHFKKALSKTQLNLSQQKLLWGYQAYLKKEKEECFDKLKSSHFDHPFFEGVRHCLLGMAHNYFGNYQFAIEHLEKSIGLLRESDSDYFKILSHTHLFLTYANRNQIHPLHSLMDAMGKFQVVNDFSRLSIQMCKSLYWQMTGEFQKSNLLIQSEFKKKSERFSSFQNSFIIIRFINYFQLKNLKKCEEELEKLKKSPGFTQTSNYKFMKILFEYLMSDAPLYVYKKDFMDSSELYEQLMVIKSLAEGDHYEAQKYWKKLSQHNGDLYQDHFEYKGAFSLFSAALKKQMSQEFDGHLDVEKMTHLKSVQEKLQYIIEHGPDSFKKEQLIKWLWNEEVSEKTKNRLRKALSEYQAKSGIKLKSYQDTYRKIKKAS
jgi:hypothetical protein